MHYCDSDTTYKIMIGGCADRGVVRISVDGLDEIKYMTQPQDDRLEIDFLLARLMPVDKEATPNGFGLESPSLETQQRVLDTLLIIASKSEECRRQVVEAAVNVMSDPEAKEESSIAHRWLTAVYVLGELRATEAIDILVKNLDQTGQNGVIMSLHFHPVATALAKTGEPAIPRLIEALADENIDIRRQAASTLATIGGTPFTYRDRSHNRGGETNTAFAMLVEALEFGGAEKKQWAALSLAWIGGKEAKGVLETALERETDPFALCKLREALTEMRRLWGN